MIVMNIFGCGLFTLIVDFADLDLIDEEDEVLHAYILIWKKMMSSGRVTGGRL